MPTLVPLWSDVCLWLLVLVGLWYARQARRHEPLRAPWRAVRRGPMALAAACVLLVYLAIALLDSVHLERTTRPADGAETAILSVLDVLLTPLRLGVETSYSAPFATRAFSQESVLTSAGRVQREYPRLRYGAAHSAESQGARARDIFQRSATGAVAGLALALSALWLALPAALGRTDRAARAAGLTLLALGVGGGVLLALATRYHVFGTDKVGSDVFYQALKSVRTGLLIGTLTTLVALPLALVLGVAAGYFRGFTDDLVQYFYTTLSAIPGVLLVAASALLLDAYMTRHAEAFTSLLARADLRLLALCGILGITSWTSLCRLLRAEALKLREMDFVHAARALGARSGQILRQHLVPNVMHIVIITTVLDFSSLVLAEAALTYLDIGVDPSMDSWGNMINAARLELAREPLVWWSLAAALSSMFGLVLAANIFADAVRDAFDPRQREFGLTPSAPTARVCE
ncbi:MAG: ABC transporter permease [Gammaproteobacteria bacterium]|nr:ABC transporter permease [Gammaproteobacteria bacterium]